jgi:hypothetical protein
VSTIFSHSIRSRGPWRAATASASPSALASSQQTIVVPATASIKVAIRSGSPTYGSAPAARIASVLAGSRVVPRTAWPSATSRRASA